MNKQKKRSLIVSQLMEIIIKNKVKYGMMTKQILRPKIYLKKGGMASSFLLILYHTQNTSIILYSLAIEQKTHFSNPISTQLYSSKGKCLQALYLRGTEELFFLLLAVVKGKTQNFHRPFLLIIHGILTLVLSLLELIPTMHLHCQNKFLIREEIPSFK